MTGFRIGLEFTELVGFLKSINFRELAKDFACSRYYGFSWSYVWLCICFNECNECDRVYLRYLDCGLLVRFQLVNLVLEYFLILSRWKVMPFGKKKV